MLDCCKPVPSNQAQIFSPSACDFASYFTEQIEVIWTELPHPSTSCCLPNKPSLLHLNISLLFPICFFSSCLREKKKLFSSNHATCAFDRFPLTASETPVSLLFFHCINCSLSLGSFHLYKNVERQSKLKHILPDPEIAFKIILHKFPYSTQKLSNLCEFFSICSSIIYIYFLSSSYYVC